MKEDLDEEIKEQSAGAGTLLQLEVIQLLRSHAHCTIACNRALLTVFSF
eukprot:SAG11_NODE_33402_length_277_cov_1.162921_1_plen_49_part_01